MNKATIIIGKALSGKTRKAKQMAADYSPDEVLWVSGKRYATNPTFPFTGCTVKTRLVIFDDVPSNSDWDDFMILVTTPVIIDLKNKTPFEHKFEKVIITCDEEITKENLPDSPSFLRRVEVLEGPFVFEKDEFDL